MVSSSQPHNAALPYALVWSSDAHTILLSRSSISDLLSRHRQRRRLPQNFNALAESPLDGISGDGRAPIQVQVLQASAKLLLATISFVHRCFLPQSVDEHLYAHACDLAARNAETFEVREVVWHD